MSQLDDIRFLMEAAEADLVDVGGFAANELLRDDIQLDPAFARFGMAVVGVLSNAPAWLAYLLAQLDAIEQRLADDRANLREECAAMSTAELVKAALDEREGEISSGWNYADVVKRDGDRDRTDWGAVIDRYQAAADAVLTMYEEDPEYAAEWPPLHHLRHVRRGESNPDCVGCAAERARMAGGGS